MKSKIPNKKPNQNPEIDSDSFLVRSLTAWLILVVLGFLIALFVGQWLVFVIVGPPIIAPCAVLTFDASCFLKKIWNRSKKLIILPLLGFGIAIFLSSFFSQVYTGRANIAKAQSLIISAENAGNDLEELQLSHQWLQQALQLLEEVPSIPGAGSVHAYEKIPSTQQKLLTVSAQLEIQERTFQNEQRAATDFAEATQLAKQAAEIVVNPPHPLSTWEAALDKWEGSLKLLEQIPKETTPPRSATFVQNR